MIHTYLKTITTGFLDLPSPLTFKLLKDCIFESNVKNLLSVTKRGTGCTPFTSRMFSTKSRQLPNLPV